MMFKSDILFTGYYGQKNTGDDAFIEVSAWGARRYWSKQKLRYLARNGYLPSSEVDTFKGYPFTISKTYKLQNNLLLNGTRCLISAGGSTIHSKLTADNIKSKAVALRNKTEGRLKMGGIGVSIGPFKTAEDEKAVKQYLKSIDFLAVRDQRSYEFATSLSLPYKHINAFDLAALLPSIYSNKSIVENQQKTIGISVCPVESINNVSNIQFETKRNKILIELLKEINKLDDIYYKFMVFNGNERVGDREITYQTAKDVNINSYEIVEYQSKTQTMWNEIASCDFVLTTRLHAAIFACFSDVPFML